MQQNFTLTRAWSPRDDSVGAILKQSALSCAPRVTESWLTSTRHHHLTNVMMRFWHIRHACLYMCIKIMAFRISARQSWWYNLKPNTLLSLMAKCNIRDSCDAHPWRNSSKLFDITCASRWRWRVDASAWAILESTTLVVLVHYLYTAIPIKTLLSLYSWLSSSLSLINSISRPTTNNLLSTHPRLYISFAIL